MPISLLIRFLPYIITIVAVLGAIYGIHHHGYKEGVNEIQTLWDKAKAEQMSAQLKKNAEDLAALRKLEEKANVESEDNKRLRANNHALWLRLPKTPCGGSGETLVDNFTGAGELPTQSELDLAEARRELDEEAYRADRTVEDCRVLNEYLKN